MRFLEIWFSGGLGIVRLLVGLHDLKGLANLLWIYMKHVYSKRVFLVFQEIKFQTDSRDFQIPFVIC